MHLIFNRGGRDLIIVSRDDILHTEALRVELGGVQPTIKSTNL